MSSVKRLNSSGSDESFGTKEVGLGMGIKGRELTEM